MLSTRSTSGRATELFRWASRMSEYVPVETTLGRLIGRDCIYLDLVRFEDWNATLVLEGHVNGNLCTVSRRGEFIPYALSFQGVLALQMLELDSCEWPIES